MAKRIGLLAASGRTLFHMNDLGLLFAIHDANTLRVTVYRLVREQILFRVQRGLFSLVPVAQLDPKALGSGLLHRYCYLTTESVLQEEGYILQSLDSLTFASSISKNVSCGEQRFLSRRFHPRFLQQTIGITQQKNYARASVERAIADLLYLDPWYHFDRPVDWVAVRALQESIGYPLTQNRYAHSA